MGLFLAICGNVSNLEFLVRRFQGSLPVFCMKGGTVDYAQDWIVESDVY